MNIIFSQKNRRPWISLAVAVITTFLFAFGPVAALAASRVKLTSPTNRSTVEGFVLAAAQVPSSTQWANFYIDGVYYNSSPPYSFEWPSTTVANSSHTISVKAFDANNNLLGNNSVTVKVSNSGTTDNTFQTLPLV